MAKLIALTKSVKGRLNSFIIKNNKSHRLDNPTYDLSYT